MLDTEHCTLGKHCSCTADCHREACSHWERNVMSEPQYCIMCGEYHVKGAACITGQKPVRDLLLVEREKTHGSFRLNAECSQGLLSVLKDHGIQKLGPVQRQAVDMICLKLARAMSTPKVKDHWDDIAGYAKLGAEACEPYEGAHTVDSLTGKRVHD